MENFPTFFNKIADRIAYVNKPKKGQQCNEIFLKSKEVFTLWKNCATLGGFKNKIYISSVL